MKKIFALIIFSCSLPVFADGLVPVSDLKDVLRDCSDRPNELRCLKRNLRELIDTNSNGNINPDERFVCKSSSGKFAVYDNDEKKFLDTHYSKTAQECGATIRATRKGLFCSTNESSKYAVRRISDYKFLSGYYNITFNDCMTTVRSASRRYVCLAGQNEKYARYDFTDNTFLDSNYSMTLEECTALAN